jgi:NAD(P)-dependent dehydrogenase (short-subunit alcohol dehydrogenase family)
MASYLITGSSRGIGLELTKLLTSSSDVRTVFATARSLSPALQEVVNSSNGRVQFVPLEVAKEDSIAAAVQEVTQKLGPGNGLDVLVNNAGIQILEQDGVGHMHGLAETLDVNVIGVQKVSAAFLPLLTLGAQKKLVIISSDLGSNAFAENYAANAPYPSYKVSKAAANMLATVFSLELGPKGFTVFALNPGWLRTDMGGPHAILEPIVGASQVAEIIQKATPADNGTFRSIYVEGNPYYDGKNIPW